MIPLNKKFTTYDVLIYAFPNSIMMLFLALYMIVDGTMVLKILGTDALAATNIIYPANLLFMAMTIMLSTGSNAIVTRLLGEGKIKLSYQCFSYIFIVGLSISILFSILGLIFIKPLVICLGANNSYINLCISYGRTLFVFAPLLFMQVYFQLYYGAAERPILGPIVIGISGVTNLILDYVFMSIMNLGISGAGLATGIGFSIGGITGLIFFLSNKKGLHLVKPKHLPVYLKKSILNGSSELISNLSTAIITFLFNIMMLHYYGNQGIAAITIVLYFQFIIISIYMGYSIGVAPIIGFKFGAMDYSGLKKVMLVSIKFFLFSSIVLVIVFYFSIHILVTIFINKNTEIYNIITNGFKIFSLSFLFTGFNIYASSLFTALSNGRVSFIISVIRSFVITVLFLIFLPIILGKIGIWIAVPLAEFLSLFISSYFIVKYRNTYHYLDRKSTSSNK